MKNIIIKLLSVTTMVLALVLVSSAVASAHVVVRPAEVVTADFQTFTMGVPNEKETPTTSVKIVVPEGLMYVSPTQKAGWQIDVEKKGEGEAAKVTAITWSGSTIAVGFRDEFTFSAKTPEKETELQWKAYQTYADGTVVSWDKSAEDGHGAEGRSSGPFSVTKVVTETEQSAAIQKAEQAAANAQRSSDRTLYGSLIALATGLLGVFLATRKFGDPSSDSKD